jgi:ribonuclease HIII
MDTTILQSNIEALRTFVDERGWRILDEKPIQSGYQLIVSDGTIKIPVAFFYTGKALIQGNTSSLKADIQTWWNTRKEPSSKPPAQTTAPLSFLEMSAAPLVTSFAGTPRIGCDESGKGDYFGPLVIAAVYVNSQSEAHLQNLGVRDSKLLTDMRMLMMAEEIKQQCPHIVVPVEPKRYNELYVKIGNLNRLLAWGHAWTLEQLLEKVPCNLAIIDQFGDSSYILNALREKGRQITIEQRTHAEEDIAVAAASILARARFVQILEQFSESVGKALPKGASDPLIITAGRRIISHYGKDKLAEIAKLHFRTTEAILQS